MKRRALLASVRMSGKPQIIPLTADAWRKALSTVHEENASRVGKEQLQEIYRETGFAPKKL